MRYFLVFQLNHFCIAFFMVVAAYPLAKVGLLLMKQLSKPVATFIKNEAKKHPQIRKYVIAPTGRAFCWAENRITTRLKGGVVEKTEITEEEAVETGANALGEIILFGLLCFILMLEYNRQSDKKAVIERLKADEFSNLQDMVLEIMEEIEKLKKSVSAIEDELEDLTNASDNIALEEKAHSQAQIHDHDFLDILIGRKRPPQTDSSSPTF